MITHLENPIIEAYKVRLNGTPQTIQRFLQEFFRSSEGELFEKNPDGGPGISIYDPRKPLQGLQTFGFEGAEVIKDFYSSIPKGELDSEMEHEIASSLDEGDLLLLQARPNLPHSGGSTALGNLRRAIYKAATLQGLIKADPRHLYLWVTGFPMFTLENGVDPGQGGTSGFSATHHPFTAPKTAADVDLLFTDPLKAKADHYDLVVNGVELGGGSRRIHSAEMQRFIMRDVLKMSEQRINDFDHLLKALAAGCPPHAGLAIGFDRLIAVICGTDSVRDVIAFPKNSKGVDLMVGSPREVDADQLGRYHLQRVNIKEQ
jgi:aspartyl-tRNA synthetase